MNFPSTNSVSIYGTVSLTGEMWLRFFRCEFVKIRREIDAATVYIQNR
jgi:hypothetical protein